MLVAAGTGVLTPMATAFHADDDRARQRRLFLESGKLCVAAAIYFFALFAFLGQSLLSIWIGPELVSAWLPLMIVACGELVPMAVAMSENTILATAQNRPLAFRGAAECGMALGLAAVLLHPYGLSGVCAALAISAICWRGLFNLLQGSRLVGVPIRQLAAYCV